jgi:hypothetical protein
MSMPSLYDTALTPNAKLWSPFDEPRFMDVVSAVVEASPQILSQRLCSEGISPELWKQIGLPDTTAPPDDRNPYTENELLDLFAAVSDRAKASPPPECESIFDFRPPDRTAGDVIDMRTFDMFYGTGSPLSLRKRSRERHASMNESPEEARILATGNSSPLSTFSGRLSSLDKLAPSMESRQPSSHSLIMNRWSATDITPFSGLEITSMQVEASSSLPGLSPPEAQSLTAGQSLHFDPQITTEDVTNGSAKFEQFQVAVKPHGKSSGRPAHSNTGSQANTPLIVMAHVRKHSSDESQETSDSISSTIQSNTDSCSAAERSSSGPSAASWRNPPSTPVKHTPGHIDEADPFHDIPMPTKYQYVKGSPDATDVHQHGMGYRAC